MGNGFAYCANNNYAACYRVSATNLAYVFCGAGINFAYVFWVNCFHVKRKARVYLHSTGLSI
jgi:hypothetical protein